MGEGVPVHYTFDEGTGTTAANSGTDPSIGAATLQGSAGWAPAAQYGAGRQPARRRPATGNRLPDNITAGMDEEFTVSTWIRPDALPNWITHVQIGKQHGHVLPAAVDDRRNGDRGFAATLQARPASSTRSG